MKAVFAALLVILAFATAPCLGRQRHYHSHGSAVRHFPGQLQGRVQRDGGHQQEQPAIVDKAGTEVMIVRTRARCVWRTRANL